MKGETFHRLHELRMENDAAKFAQDEMRPRFERMAGRHENGTAPRAVSAYQLFQTPVAVARQLVELAGINRNSRVLEPSAGLGRILDAIQPHAWDVTAIEVAPNLCGELYRQERAEVKILQRDFLAVTPQELGQFDAVIMNPPFHLRSDIRHIRHALQFVKDGGRLVSVCMDTHHRREAFEKLGQWIDLPAKSFKEAATNVNCGIIVIQL